MSMSPKARRERAMNAAVELAKVAPKITLTEVEDGLVGAYVEGHYDNERTRWLHYTGNTDPKVWRPPSDIKMNLMEHQIACEMGVCELLDVDYLPRHEWQMRKELGIMRRDTCAMLLDTEVRVEMRILGGAQGIYVTPADVEMGRIVLWGEVRLADCDCGLCKDAEPRPDSRVRLLGGLRVTQPLYDAGTVVASHKNDDDRFIPADALFSPYEMLDDDGHPLIDLTLDTQP